MLSTCIKHWMFDVGISTLFDNVTGNLRNNVKDAHTNIIQTALHEALNGYPYPKIRTEDYDTIINIATINLIYAHVDITEEVEKTLHTLTEEMRE